MEDSTSRAAKPVTPAGGAPNIWRRMQQWMASFMEAVGEVRQGVDAARQIHPTISAYHDPRR